MANEKQVLGEVAKNTDDVSTETKLLENKNKVAGLLEYKTASTTTTTPTPTATTPTQTAQEFVLKGGSRYTPAYAEKLMQMHAKFKEAGFDMTEHSLNRILGRINQGKVGSIDEVITVMKTGTKYADLKEGGYV